MTAYRNAEWADLLADALGAAVGIGLYFTPLRRLLRFVDRSLAALLLR
jgi:VanZ family protein